MSGSAGTALSIGAIGSGASDPLRAGTGAKIGQRRRNWLNAEPIRLGWFQVRAADADLDPEAVIADALRNGLNAIMMTAGGNYAFYPTSIPLHERSPSLKDGMDFFGGVAAAAGKNGIRIGSRFDFSQQSQSAFDAHPEWFMRKADGSPYSERAGKFRPCMNSDFYKTQAIKVIDEVMDRYRPDLVFMNNMVNPEICYCKACDAAYHAKYGKPIPKTVDAEYAAFRQAFYDRDADLITAAVHAKSSDTLVINADSFRADGWHTETRMNMLPTTFYLYASSELVNRQRNSFPEKAAINVIVGYSTNFSRLVVMPREEMKVHAYQAIAHGSPLTYALTGTTLRQDDQRDMAGMREIFGWHKANSDLYGAQTSDGRVVMLVEPETMPRHSRPEPLRTSRGLYRMLTQAHIPVAISEDAAILSRGRFDLVIVTEGAPVDGVREHVARGGRALFVNRDVPFGLPKPLGVNARDGYAYVEIRDPKAFPLSQGVKFITAAGGYPIPLGATAALLASAAGEALQVSPFQQYPDEPGALLTFVPQMTENPSEFAFMDQQRTNVPGLIVRDFERGRLACIPWDIGGIYMRSGMAIHANLFADIVDMLLPGKRQIITDAHPTVEIVPMRQPALKRTVLHLINASGQSQNGYFDRIVFGPITIEVAGTFNAATARAAGSALSVRTRDERTSFVLPSLHDYEAIILS